MRSGAFVVKEKDERLKEDLMLMQPRAGCGVERIDPLRLRQ